MISYFSYQTTIRRRIQLKLAVTATILCIFSTPFMFFYFGCCIDNQIQQFADNLPIQRAHAETEKHFCFLKCSDYIFLQGNDFECSK